MILASQREGRWSTYLFLVFPNSCPGAEEQNMGQNFDRPESLQKQFGKHIEQVNLHVRCFYLSRSAAHTLELLVLYS